MGSKGRIPPRRPLPGPGMVHPEPFGPAIRPPPGGFPPFDMLPPSEVLGQKLAAQHIEMQKLVTENQKLAATHGTLRQELATAQHELQMLHARIGDMKSESEHQKRVLMGKIARMETDLEAGHSIKIQLQQVQVEAQSLHAARPELISKVQKLNQDLQRSHSDVQQIPILLSELDSLRQEYQHCRATYDYEKKLCNDHLESLQVMEKNYMTMARELEKLRAELTNSSNFDRRTGGQYGANSRYNESDAPGSYPVGQNAGGHGYGVSQGKGPHSVEGSTSLATDAAVGGSVAGGTTPPVGSQSGSGNAPVIQRTGYEAARGLGFDTQRGPTGAGYNVHGGIVGPGFDAQRGTPVPGYGAQRGPGYDAHTWAAYEGHGTNFNGHGAPPYDSHRGPGHDVRRGGYEQAKSVGYGASSGGPGSQGEGATVKNTPYVSATAPARGAGMGYGAPPQGGNASQR